LERNGDVTSRSMAATKSSMAADRTETGRPKQGADGISEKRCGCRVYGEFGNDDLARALPRRLRGAALRLSRGLERLDQCAAQVGDVGHAPGDLPQRGRGTHRRRTSFGRGAGGTPAPRHPRARTRSSCRRRRRGEVMRRGCRFSDGRPKPCTVCAAAGAPRVVVRLRVGAHDAGVDGDAGLGPTPVAARRCGEGGGR